MPIEKTSLGVVNECDRYRKYSEKRSITGKMIDGYRFTFTLYRR